MALYAGISQIFLALGPLVGGLLTEYVTWRAVFLLNVPVGLATLALVAVAGVPEPPGRRGRASQSADAALVVAGLALVTLGRAAARGVGRDRRSCCWRRASG